MCEVDRSHRASAASRRTDGKEADMLTRFWHWQAARGRSAHHRRVDPYSAATSWTLAPPCPGAFRSRPRPTRSRAVSKTLGLFSCSSLRKTCATRSLYLTRRDVGQGAFSPVKEVAARGESFTVV